MKIAVCCKITPDTEDVRVSPEGAVDIAGAKWGVSDYDLQAIQAAAELTEESGAQAVALTVGTTAIDQSRLTKDLMSRGEMSELYRVVDDGVSDLDTAALANVLAAMAQKADADVVLCGEGSSDRYQRIMGPQVAAVLGWPCVNAANRVVVEGDAIVVERDLEDGVEVVELTSPCVIAVTSTINEPQLPKMKAVLAAGKKPVATMSLADLGVSVEPVVQTVSSSAPVQPGRRKVILEGSADEVAAALVEKLSAEKVL